MNVGTTRAALRRVGLLVDLCPSQRQAVRYSSASRDSVRHAASRPSRHRQPTSHLQLCILPSAQVHIVRDGSRSVSASGARFASTASAVAPKAPTSSFTTSKPKPAGTSLPISDLTNGLNDSSPLPSAPATATADGQPVDWTRSFHGLSSTPFAPEAAKVLLEPITEEDIEIKADGIIYLPEIKYRRILHRAFGPGGWGLAPRGETLVTGKSVTREYGLVVHGRLVSIARGEQQYFDPEGIPTATEGCKSNALMRCCKDLGIASELWDPIFIRKFLAKSAREVWVEHVTTKKKRKITVRKGMEVPYPYKETRAA